MEIIVGLIVLGICGAACFVLRFPNWDGQLLNLQIVIP